MLKRVASGLAVSAVVLLVVLACGPWPCLLFALALFYLAQDELRLLAHAAGLPTEDVAVPVFGFAYLLAAALESQCMGVRCWGGGAAPWWLPSSEAVAVIAPLAFLAVGVLRRKPEKGLERFAVAWASFWYAAILLGFLVKVTLRFDSFDHGKWLLMYGLFVMKMNDVGAYFVGMKFGRNRRRLIPAISPAKSVVGLWGGYAFALATSLLFAGGAALWNDGRLGAVPLSVGHAIILGLLLPTAGTLGDLAESLLKRSAGVKDSASHIPGIGGVLDMLDSPLFAAPVLYLYVERFF